MRFVQIQGFAIFCAFKIIGMPQDLFYLLLRQLGQLGQVGLGLN